MQYILSPEPEPGLASLSQRLIGELQAGRKVLWLVCGGSNILLSTAVMKQLPQELTSHLTILLTDERYGPVGHKDSNAYQLSAAGFDSKEASFLPVLTPVTDESVLVAVRHYTAIAESAFAEAEIIIGQFGIGRDGHIAGILPNSVATATAEFVSGYSAPPLERLTLTFHALKRLAVAYAFVYGDDKRQALEVLQQQTLPFAEHPAQILKELPEAYIYNDQLGDPA